MTLRFVPLRRIAGLTVVITLITAPVASAQSPAPASNTEGEAPANTVLLSRAAFSRLVHAPQPDVAPVPVVGGAPRPSILRQGTTAMAREAKAAFTKAPQQKSWASRHKKMITRISVGAGVFFGIWGLFAAACYMGACGD